MVKRTQTWLPEAGLYYYKARIYSPTLGGFLQTDPIGYGDGLNWYNYVGSDPINFTDPTGLMADDECIPGDCIRVIGRRLVEPENSLAREGGGGGGIKVRFDGPFSNRNLPNTGSSQNPGFGDGGNNNPESCNQTRLDAGNKIIDFGQDLNRAGDDGIVLGLGSAIVGAGFTFTGVGAPLGVPLTAFGVGLTKFSLGAKAVGGIAVGTGTIIAGFTLGRQDIVDSGVAQGLISGIPSARQGGITGDLLQDIVSDNATGNIGPSIPTRCPS